MININGKIEFGGAQAFIDLGHFYLYALTKHIQRFSFSFQLKLYNRIFNVHSSVYERVCWCFFIFVAMVSHMFVSFHLNSRNHTNESNCDWMFVTSIYTHWMCYVCAAAHGNPKEISMFIRTWTLYTHRETQSG